MSGPGIVALGAILFAIFLLVVGALVWQEARRRPEASRPPYVVDDAIHFISARLDQDVLDRIEVSGVRRVIEWELHYLQGLAQKRRRTPVETVAGGSDASIDYVVSQIAEVNGVTYDRRDVAEVLRLEADYLLSIGAVGSRVDTDDEGGREA